MFADELRKRLDRRPLWAVGLMSGTSLDGVDAALVEIHVSSTGSTIQMKRFHDHSFGILDPSEIREIARGEAVGIDRLSRLQMDLALEHEIAVRTLCSMEGLSPEDLIFVAAHGITLCHRPGGARGHGFQMHAGPALAAWLGTLVIDDFRAGDIALGGQGAPLAPVCDLKLRTSEEEDRVVLNLGGIANLSCIPAGARKTSELIAADVGPANLPLDELRRRQTSGREHLDRDGALALSGISSREIADRLLSQSWVRQALPRSFGREQFGPDWLEDFLQEAGDLSAADQMATLVAVETGAVAIFLEEIAGSWRRRPESSLHVLVTGGGRHNRAWMSALADRLPDARVEGMEVLGENPDAKEAVDFSLLGWMCLCAEGARTEPITGADENIVLGSLHAPWVGQS